MPLYSYVNGPSQYQIDGEVDIENGIYTRTSRTSTESVYLTQNYTVDGSFEVGIKFKANQTQDESYLFNGNEYNGTIRIQNNRLICRVFPEWTYASGITINGMSTIQIGTIYWVKYIQTNSDAKFYISTDGKNYTLEGSTTYTRTKAHTFSSKVTIGSYAYQSNKYNFDGDIDLNETYIKVNGTPLFGKCPVRVKVNSGLAKYTTFGSPTFSNGVVSNLSDSNYLKLGTSIPNDWKDLELCFKISTGTDNTHNRFLISGSSNVIIYMDHNGFPQVNMYWNSVGIGNAIADSSITSWEGFVKYELTRTSAKGYHSIDGENWILSTNKTGLELTSGMPTIFVGKGTRSGGTIDLSKSYIKINGSYTWRGSDYYQNLNNYKIHQDNFSKYYTIVDGKLTWANPNIYLESTGTQYIDTGYKYTSGDNIKLCVSPLESGVDLAVYGVYPGGTNELAYYDSRFRGNLSGVAGEFGPKYTVGKLYKFECINGYWSLEGIIFGNQQLSSNTTYTSYLFARNYSNDKKLSKSRVYYYKVIRNEESVQHFVPVPKGLLIGNFVVPSNGMFDIVTQTFYGNSGTGEFEIGGIPDDYIIEGGKMIWCNPDISLENNSNWSAYINTGIIPTNNMRLLVTAQLTDTTHTYDGNLLGSRKTAGTSEFCLWHNTNPGQGGFVYNSIWNTDTSSFGRDDIAGNKNEFKYDGSDFTINGVTARTRIGDITNFTSTYPIYVYALNINNTSVDNRRFRGKIYEVVFWSGSTILQYLVPVPKGILIGDKIAPSNCMFDLVTQTFFENQGTGEFTIGGLSGDYIFIGDDIVWCNPDIYLRAKGTNNGGPQYIDTGLKLSNTSRVKVDFQFNVNSSWLFAADNNDDGYPRFGFIYSSGKHFAPVWYGANKAYAVGTSRFDKNTVDFNKVNVTLNKTEYVYSAFTDRTFTTTQTCYLFANHMRDGSVSQTAQYDAQIYNCSMYNSDKLLRYFIPVTTNMQISGTTIPAPGMWDMVTKKFFPNKGTGSFTYGKDS